MRTVRLWATGTWLRERFYFVFKHSNNTRDDGARTAGAYSHTRFQHTLSAHDGLWEITDITCSSGESTPIQGEFSFDREGYLLTNIPAPLDPNSWYFVFEESGTPGHTVALILNNASTCIATDATESVCSTDKFTQAMKAHQLILVYLLSYFVTTTKT